MVLCFLLTHWSRTLHGSPSWKYYCQQRIGHNDLCGKWSGQNRFKLSALTGHQPWYHIMCGFCNSSDRNLVLLVTSNQTRSTWPWCPVQLLLMKIVFCASQVVALWIAVKIQQCQLWLKIKFPHKKKTLRFYELNVYKLFFFYVLSF